MAKREPVRPSPKLLALLKDFQQIAGMAGYLTQQMDAPQLRMIFTLYARTLAPTEEAAQARVADLQAWCDRVGVDLREGSSSAVLPPQTLIAHPQATPAGMWLLVATMNFSTKITDTSYQRVRTAVQRAYKRAVTLREKGLDVALHLLDAPQAWETEATGELPLLDLPAEELEPDGGAMDPPEDGTDGAVAGGLQTPREAEPSEAAETPVAPEAETGP